VTALAATHEWRIIIDQRDRIDNGHRSHQSEWVDLNLLVALDALLTERSVTLAAARVGLRQSAMSHNLARLCALFGDELLIRGRTACAPTRAPSLIDPVRITLAQISALVSRDEAFDARTAERSFRIGLTDSAEVLLGSALFPPLRGRAGHPVAPLVQEAGGGRKGPLSHRLVMKCQYSRLLSCNPPCSPRRRWGNFS
jgi:hypothetical protein